MLGRAGLLGSVAGVFSGGPLLPPAYSATDYMFANNGFRQANNNSAGNATSTKSGQSLLHLSPPFAITNPRFFFPNYYVQEGVTYPTPEEVISNAYQIEAFCLVIGGVAYPSTISTPVNVDPSGGTGGAYVQVMCTIPASTVYNMRIALAYTANTAIPVYRKLATGETTRQSDTTSFATVVNGTGSVSVTGSVSSNWGGFMPAPVFCTAQGLDGRPIVLSVGDSISYGKGQYASVTPNNSNVIGLVPLGMDENVNSKMWPCGDLTVAGSSPDSLNMSATVYNNRRALLAQNGNIPFNMIICEHGNNTDLSNLANVKTNMKGCIARLRQFWPGKPIVQTTMIVKATSTDAFRTLANQTVNSTDSSTGTRFQWNDYVMSTKVDGLVDYVVNTYQGLSYDLTAANRDKIKIAPFTATLTRATAASDTTIFLNAAPTLNTGLALDPNSGSANNRIVTGVNPSGTAGEWQVDTSVGSANGIYAAKAIGTLVGEEYYADGVPSTTGLHPTYTADLLVQQSSWVPFKNLFTPISTGGTTASWGNASQLTWGDTSPTTWSA